MKFLNLLSGLLLISGSVLASTCQPGTLQDYINLGAGGCQTGAVTFGGFASAPGQNNATSIPLTQVLINPGGTLYMPSLQFVLNQSASTGQLYESFFRFKVLNSTLVGARLNLNSPSATGNGAVTAGLDICRGGSFAGNSPSGACGNQSPSLLTVATADFSMLMDSTAFAPTKLLDLFADLTADGGVGNGTARFNSATVSFDAIPEPSVHQLMLGGFGVLGLVHMLRNRSGVKNESV